MPEKIATLCFSIFRSARAIWIAFRIPKSPHPGHQSLWTSVWKSAGFNTVSGAMAQHLPLGGLADEDLTDGGVELRARHRAARELHDRVRDERSRVLADQAGEGRRVVHLHVDDPLPALQELRDVLGGERGEEPHLQEADLVALLPELVHRVEERAPPGAPAHEQCGRGRS